MQLLVSADQDFTGETSPVSTVAVGSYLYILNSPHICASSICKAQAGPPSTGALEQAAHATCLPPGVRCSQGGPPSAGCMDLAGAQRRSGICANCQACEGSSRGTGCSCQCHGKFVVSAFREGSAERHGKGQRPRARKARCKAKR